jgi:hypothetical protein
MVYMIYIYIYIYIYVNSLIMKDCDMNCVELLVFRELGYDVDGSLDAARGGTPAERLLRDQLRQRESGILHCILCVLCIVVYFVVLCVVVVVVVVVLFVDVCRALADN